MSSLKEHSYTCFGKVGCRAPCKYSPDNDPSVQNGLDPEMVDHLGTKGSSPSTYFSRIMIEAKYLSAPTRSSTSHSSLMVYPRSGTSLSSTRSPSKDVPQTRLHAGARALLDHGHPSIPCYRHASCLRSHQTATRYTIGLHLAEVKHLGTTKVVTVESTLKKDCTATKASTVPESPRALIDGTTAIDTKSLKG
ncbi:hypothetical protein BHM03_00026678 [Ensete ventricosum]|nr:hypothetical protein BHM03_00026678 [Ensete ventricosum]